MAQEKVDLVVYQIGQRPAWYDDAIHAELLYRYLQPMASIHHGRSFPRVQIVMAPSATGESYHIAYDAQGRVIEKLRVDVSAPFFYALCASASPFSPLHFEGSLSVEAATFLEGVLASIIHQMGVARQAVYDKGGDDTEMAEDEDLLREVCAFFAGVNPTRGSR